MHDTEGLPKGAVFQTADGVLQISRLDPNEPEIVGITVAEGNRWGQSLIEIELTTHEAWAVVNAILEMIRERTS